MSSEEQANEDQDAVKQFLDTADNEAEDNEPFMKRLEQETKDGVIDFTIQSRHLMCNLPS